MDRRRDNNYDLLNLVRSVKDINEVVDINDPNSKQLNRPINNLKYDASRSHLRSSLEDVSDLVRQQQHDSMVHNSKKIAHYCNPAEVQTDANEFVNYPVNQNSIGSDTDVCIAFDNAKPPRFQIGDKVSPRPESDQSKMLEFKQTNSPARVAAWK